MDTYRYCTKVAAAYRYIRYIEAVWAEGLAGRQENLYIMRRRFGHSVAGRHKSNSVYLSIGRQIDCGSVYGRRCGSWSWGCSLCL